MSVDSTLYTSRQATCCSILQHAFLANIADIVCRLIAADNVCCSGKSVFSVYDIKFPSMCNLSSILCNSEIHFFMQMFLNLTEINFENWIFQARSIENIDLRTQNLEGYFSSINHELVLCLIDEINSINFANCSLKSDA